MHPNHIPEFRDPLPPASSERLDGRATGAITRQRARLEQQVGRVDEARLNDQENTPLYGYSFTLDNGTEVQLAVDVNAEGEPTGADRDFVEARNRAAVLRSRERSRGSRSFNYAFQRNRGNGPGGHGYQFEQAEREYHEQLSEFIARKVSGAHLNSQNLTTEAVSRAVIQEQRQMGVLENMAAEQKSGNRFMNFLRNHKKSRIAAGLALTGIGMVGLATGQLEVAIPAFAARSALSATGGYLLGRTGWDAFQGRRARKLPHDDPRMAGSNNGDFSGPLTPRAAFERLIKLHGAEARAGSHDPRRQDLIHRLGSGLVHEYYTGELDFSAGRSRDVIRQQVTALHNNRIRELQLNRLRSDQTQSRNRHRAGLVGGVAMGALSMAHPVGAELHLNFLPGFGGGGHGAEAHAGTHGHGGGSINHDSASKPVGPNSSANTAAGGSSEINIYGGSGSGTIEVASFQDAAGHAHHASRLAAEHLHETFRGISTSELHVKPGGGFISTLQDQYHLSAAQADAMYHDMYSQLHDAPGTYLDGSDIRISAPGDFRLPAGARAILEEKLKALHRMPEHLLQNGANNVNHSGSTVDATTGGTKAPDYTYGHSGNGTGGTAAPGYDVSINGGSGNDHINVFLPDANTPQGQHLQALIDGHYVTETGMGSLTPDQFAQAQQYIANFVHNGGFTDLSTSAKAAAQGSIENYIQASIDHPGSSTDAQAAAERIHQLWLALGHNLNNLTTDQAENLENDLLLANAS